MEDKPVADGYSLWLIPEKQFYETVSKKIKEISIKYNAPLFEPHVTLLGNIIGDRDAIQEKSNKIAENIPNLTLKSSKLSYSENYFKSLYVEIDEDKELYLANLSARQVFKMDLKEKYNPHMSLIYATMPQVEKEKIIKEIGKSLEKTFKIEKLSLYSTKGHIEEWSKIDEFEIA